MPQFDPSTPSGETYLTFDINARAAPRVLREPFSGPVDLDTDGKSNAEEWKTFLQTRGTALSSLTSEELALFAAQATGQTTSAGSGGSCFIAVAAYGTPLKHEIQVLRDFRDRALLSNRAGSAFVDTYYRLSPPLARHLARDPRARKLVQKGLDPVVQLAAAGRDRKPGLLTFIGLAGLGLFVTILCKVQLRLRNKTTSNQEHRRTCRH